MGTPPASRCKNSFSLAPSKNYIRLVMHDASLSNLPAAFRTRFDMAALSEDPSTLVVVNGEGRMLWTNSAWKRFADDNGSSQLLGQFGVGASYFDGITGPLREYFRCAFQHALSSERVFEQEYECSSPRRRRWMRLRALPIAGEGLLLEHSQTCDAIAPIEVVDALADNYLRPSGLILQCANCRRVQRVGSRHWDWIPEWVATAHPRTTHGICQICVGFYWAPYLNKDSSAR